jgi:hypothetical protein
VNTVKVSKFIAKVKANCKRGAYRKSEEVNYRSFMENRKIKTAKKESTEKH